MSPCVRRRPGRYASTVGPTFGGYAGARVRLTGYPDMSACQGHAIIGWSLEVVEQSGGTQATARIEERPWMHNSVLTYVVEWA